MNERTVYEQHQVSPLPSSSVSVDVTVPSSAPSQTRLSDYFTRSDATDIVDRTPFLFPFILFDHMNGIKQESMRAS